MHEESVMLEVKLVPDASMIVTTQHVVDEISRRVLSDSDLGWRIDSHVTQVKPIGLEKLRRAIGQHRIGSGF